MNSELPNEVLDQEQHVRLFAVSTAIVCSCCRTAIASADWAFESGDHAEPVDVLTVERVEIVKGPASLLYGSNAIGGVVNTISGHDSPHKGINGYLTGIGSTNGPQGGGSGGIEYGSDRWLMWANVGGQRSGDYDTPIGDVENSFSREASAAAGFGYYPKKGFFSFNYNFNKRRYGIPFDPADDDAGDRRTKSTSSQHRVSRWFSRDWIIHQMPAPFRCNYNDYDHAEIESLTGEIRHVIQEQFFSLPGHVRSDEDRQIFRPLRLLGNAS